MVGLMAAEKTEHVMVRLTPDVLAQLKAEASRRESTVAQTVRLAIKEHLSATVPTYSA